MLSSVTAVILAAGKGTRMKSAQPKAMQLLAHKPMISHLIDTVRSLTDKIIVVTGPDMPDLEQAVVPCRTVTQIERKGTGHAALIASPLFDDEEILVLYADNPLITAETLSSLISLRQSHNAALAVIGMELEEAGHYGRLIKNEQGTIERIVEYKDATDAERAVTLCNAGMICAKGASLKKWLEQLTPDNAQNEFYLTDIVALAAQEGPVICLEADKSELLGVNSRIELAQAEHIIQTRLRHKIMENGVTLTDPLSVYLSVDTVIEADVLIEPHVFIGPGVVIKAGAHIRAFSHLEGCHIEKNVTVGPFARLRPGTLCQEETHVGNFVELKNTTLAKGSKANHLSYLGDSEIGENVNIGAGTITCNYDGYFKHKTTIGAHSFIGSNTLLVAPITIGEDTLIAAGSVLTKNVPARAMSFGRARQTILEERGTIYKYSLKMKKEQS